MVQRPDVRRRERDGDGRKGAREREKRGAWKAGGGTLFLPSRREKALPPRSAGGFASKNENVDK